jgi:hypothetical protein
MSQSQNNTILFASHVPFPKMISNHKMSARLEISAQKLTVPNATSPAKADKLKTFTPTYNFIDSYENLAKVVLAIPSLFSPPSPQCTIHCHYINQHWRHLVELRDFDWEVVVREEIVTKRMFGFDEVGFGDVGGRGKGIDDQEVQDGTKFSIRSEWTGEVTFETSQNTIQLLIDENSNLPYTIILKNSSTFEAELAMLTQNKLQSNSAQLLDLLQKTNSKKNFFQNVFLQLALTDSEARFLSEQDLQRVHNEPNSGWAKQTLERFRLAMNKWNLCYNLTIAAIEPQLDFFLQRIRYMVDDEGELDTDKIKKVLEYYKKLYLAVSTEGVEDGKLVKIIAKHLSSDLGTFPEAIIDQLPLMSRMFTDYLHDPNNPPFVRLESLYKKMQERRSNHVPPVFEGILKHSSNFKRIIQSGLRAAIARKHPITQIFRLDHSDNVLQDFTATEYLYYGSLSPDTMVTIDDKLIYRVSRKGVHVSKFDLKAQLKDKREVAKSILRCTNAVFLITYMAKDKTNELKVYKIDFKNLLSKGEPRLTSYKNIPKEILDRGLHSHTPKFGREGASQTTDTYEKLIQQLQGSGQVPTLRVLEALIEAKIQMELHKPTLVNRVPFIYRFGRVALGSFLLQCSVERGSRVVTLMIDEEFERKFGVVKPQGKEKVTNFVADRGRGSDYSVHSDNENSDEEIDRQLSPAMSVEPENMRDRTLSLDSNGEINKNDQDEAINDNHQYSKEDFVQKGLAIDPEYLGWFEVPLLPTLSTPVPYLSPLTILHLDITTHTCIQIIFSLSQYTVNALFNGRFVFISTGSSPVFEGGVVWAGGNRNGLKVVLENGEMRRIRLAIY